MNDELTPNEFPGGERSRAAVQLGSRVRLHDAHDGEEEYTIVRRGEANLGRGRISAESPLARALLGAKRGDEVRVQTPDGTLTVTVVDLIAPEEGESTTGPASHDDSQMFDPFA